MTSALQPSAEVLPGLALLGHQVKILPAEGSALLEAPEADLLLVDGRQDLAGARDLCRLIRTTGTDVPVILVVTEGGLAVVVHDWGMDDVILHTSGPAELEARIKLAIGRLAAAREAADPEAHVIRSGEVLVDEATYTAKIGGRPLDLTFKEFELLKFLAQHPGRVFSRQQLLQEVWGYDYFGGTRTVDVHVRRLRAKLGPENETLIGTVRNVGYRFVLPMKEKESKADAARMADQRRRRRTPSHALVSGVVTDPLDVISAVRRSSREVDGHDPLDEAASLRLKHHGLTGLDHWVEGTDGFALLRGTVSSTWPSHPRPGAAGSAGGWPTRRSRSAGPVTAWSHGDHPAAARLAERHGMRRARELWVMRRPSSVPLPELVLPARRLHPRLPRRATPRG